MSGTVDILKLDMVETNMLTGAGDLAEAAAIPDDRERSCCAPHALRAHVT
jgi:hypothetical protein